MKQWVSAYIEYLIYEKRYSKHTIINYQKDLEEWEIFCQKELINPFEVQYSDVRAYLNDCYLNQLQRSTVSRKLSSIFIKGKSSVI